MADNVDYDKISETRKKDSLRKYQNKKNYIKTTSIFGIILVFLLLATLLRSIASNGDFSELRLPTFTSFLEMLSSASPIQVPFVNVDTIFLGVDWGVFNFLLDFFSFFVSLFNVILFFINGIISVLSYVIYFIQWLFLP